MEDEKNAFLKTVQDAAKIIAELAKTKAKFALYSHLDADGLAAAGIVGKALSRLDVPFRTRILPWLDANFLDEVAADDSDLIILTDLGSGYLDLVREKLSKRRVMILDHHPISGTCGDNVVQVNPNVFGIDGTREISGAGLAYLTMRAVDAQNADLAPIAVVGALGDMQDYNQQRSLIGLNTMIVDEGKAKGILASKKDLIFFGYETRPIHKALARSMQPFIPNISGSEGQAYAFLVSIGVPPKHGNEWRKLRDLSTDEKRKIANELAEYLMARGMHRQVQYLIGEVYSLLTETEKTPLHDGREFATLLNAAGRMNQFGLGVSLAMGVRDKTVEEAQRLLDTYRATIGKYINWAMNTQGALEEKNAVYVLHGKNEINDRMISIIASGLVATLPQQLKPLLAYSFVESAKIAKFSVRTVDEVVSSGIDLGSTIKAVAEQFGGSGGGHDIAAGAEVPIAKLDPFLQAFDAAIANEKAEIEKRKTETKP